jgi:hypothetical protein
MAKTIVEGTRGGSVLGMGGRLDGRPRRVTVAAVEPHGAAAESPDAGGSAQDGTSASGIGKSQRRWMEPVAVEPHGTVAKSPDAGGSARDGASAGHGGRGSRRGRWSAAGWRWWSRVGRLSNRRMWEDPFGMFKVTIIG